MKTFCRRARGGHQKMQEQRNSTCPTGRRERTLGRGTSLQTVATMGKEIATRLNLTGLRWLPVMRRRLAVSPAKCGLDMRIAM